MKINPMCRFVCIALVGTVVAAKPVLAMELGDEGQPPSPPPTSIRVDPRNMSAYAGDQLSFWATTNPNAGTGEVQWHVTDGLHITEVTPSSSAISVVCTTGGNEPIAQVVTGTFRGHSSTASLAVKLYKSSITVTPNSPIDVYLPTRLTQPLQLAAQCDQGSPDHWVWSGVDSSSGATASVAKTEGSDVSAKAEMRVTVQGQQCLIGSATKQLKFRALTNVTVNQAGLPATEQFGMSPVYQRSTMTGFTMRTITTTTTTVSEQNEGECSGSVSGSVTAEGSVKVEGSANWGLYKVGGEVSAALKTSVNTAIGGKLGWSTGQSRSVSDSRDVTITVAPNKTYTCFAGWLVAVVSGTYEVYVDNNQDGAAEEGTTNTWEAKRITGVAYRDDITNLE